MSKKTYRVRNWKEYNEALVQRGSVTFWFDEETIQKWLSQGQNDSRGRPEYYSDTCIECALTLRALFKLTLRATEGFIKSLLKMMKLPLKTPDYTTLCKRQKGLEIQIKKQSIRNNEGIHLVIDSTGLKVFGEGEWKVRQHGQERKRVWRKIHLAVNAKTHDIESCLVTTPGIQDCQGLPELLRQIENPINEFIGDGAFDRFSCYEEAVKRQCKGIFPVQRNAATTQERSENKKKASEAAWRNRDKVIEEVRRVGRKEWKIANGYHQRSLAETAIFRIKTLLGRKLCSRTMAHQKVEMRLWCLALNKLNTLGMPRTVVT